MSVSKYSIIKQLCVTYIGLENNIPKELYEIIKSYLFYSPDMFAVKLQKDIIHSYIINTKTVDYYERLGHTNINIRPTQYIFAVDVDHIRGGIEIDIMAHFCLKCGKYKYYYSIQILDEDAEDIPEKQISRLLCYKTITRDKNAIC